MTFGPQLPPGFKKRKPQNDVPAEESEKEIINEKSASDSKAASDSNTKPKVSIGPQLPPHLKRQKIQQEQEIVVKEIVKVRQSIEKEEWGYGPAIPKQLSEQEKAELEEREKREMIEMIEARAFAPVASAGMKKTAGDKEKVVRREDWMLKPPEANRATTKLTSRTFSHKGTHEVDQSIWTSTPDTKAKDELDAAKKQLYQQDKARAKKASLQFIEKNAANKPESLVEMYQKDHVAEDISSKRFDRERDIVGRTIGRAELEKRVQDGSQDLTSKFARGKYE